MGWGSLVCPVLPVPEFFFTRAKGETPAAAQYSTVGEEDSSNRQDDDGKNQSLVLPRSRAPLQRYIHSPSDPNLIMFVSSFFKLQTVTAGGIWADGAHGDHALPCHRGDDSGKRSARHQSWLANQLFSDSAYLWRSLEQKPTGANY